MHALSFTTPPHSPPAEALRREVRAFLAKEIASRTPQQRGRSWGGFDAEFSRKMGAQRLDRA